MSSLGHAFLPGLQVVGTTNPVAEWVSNSCWGAVCALREIEEYQHLPEDLVSSSKRWREWMELERPEDEPLPGRKPSDIDMNWLGRIMAWTFLGRLYTTEP
jgi:hypothetical protein